MRIAGSLMLVATLAACSLHSGGAEDGPGIGASGTGTTRSYAVADFTGIELAGADDVDIRVGTGFSVRAEGPSEDLDRLRIDKGGDTLTIGRRRQGGISWSHGNKVKIFVTLPRLAKATVAGSGTMAVDRVEGPRFSGTIAGSGDLNVAALAVDDADLAIAGSGDVRAAGTAKRLEVDIAGSGSLDAAGLRADSAKIAVAGSGDVRAAVNGEADVSLMGSGNVDLGANAHCRTSKMGSGSVRCGR